MSGLPAALHAVLERVGQGLDAMELRDKAGTISGHYRRRGTSQGVVRTEADALAYAVTRMPATYAAIAMALDELLARAPDYAPGNMIDVGCGPGTAFLAAAERFRIGHARLVDHNSAFLELSSRLAATEPSTAVEHVRCELRGWEPVEPADLIICGYSLTELEDAAAAQLVTRLWRRTRGALLIAEPGRPADYRRLMVWRRLLVAEGATILAPCPHALDCPLPAEDWCHFSVRLERRKAHRAAKGAALGYEDEKVSYLIAARPDIGAPAKARVLRRPVQSKVQVQVALCGAAGLVNSSVPSRDKARHSIAKRLDWGDATEFLPDTSAGPIAAAEAAD
jgi:ribosomal protein RSM22 (predicted rRNA methylase)